MILKNSIVRGFQVLENITIVFLTPPPPSIYRINQGINYAGVIILPPFPSFVFYLHNILNYITTTHCAPQLSLHGPLSPIIKLYIR